MRKVSPRFATGFCAPSQHFSQHCQLSKPVRAGRVTRCSAARCSSAGCGLVLFSSLQRLLCWAMPHCSVPALLLEGTHASAPCMWEGGRHVSFCSASCCRVVCCSVFCLLSLTFTASLPCSGGSLVLLRSSLSHPSSRRSQRLLTAKGSQQYAQIPVAAQG